MHTECQFQMHSPLIPYSFPFCLAKPNIRKLHKAVESFSVFFFFSLVLLCTVFLLTGRLAVYCYFSPFNSENSEIYLIQMHITNAFTDSEPNKTFVGGKWNKDVERDGREESSTEWYTIIIWPENKRKIKKIIVIDLKFCCVCHAIDTQVSGHIMYQRKLHQFSVSFGNT